MVEILPVENMGDFPARELGVDKDKERGRKVWSVKRGESSLSCRGRWGLELRNLESMLCVWGGGWVGFELGELVAFEESEERACNKWFGGWASLPIPTAAFRSA